MALIEVSDLTPFADIEQAKAEAMIADALALAAKAAPCILDDDFADTAAAKAILRRVLLRWNEVGSGAYSTKTQSAGGFSTSTTMDTRTPRRLFSPEEVTDLQSLCAQGTGRGAYTITLAGSDDTASGPIWWP